MTRVIAVLNAQQGGGKTTTILNLATAFKRQGLNVLAVDLDPDGMLGRRVRLANPSHAARAQSARVISTVESWHLMPSATSIGLFHARALYRIVRSTSFQDELRSLFDAYDYVLLDGSTREETVLLEALSLADEVIVPIDSESLQFYDAVEQLQRLLGTRTAINPHLRFGGVFLARYAPRFRRAREMLTTLFDALGPINCFSAYLNDSDELRQAEKRRMSVLADAPESRAGKAFTSLAEQILATTATPLLAAPAQSVAEAVAGPLLVSEAALEMPEVENVIEPAGYAADGEETDWLALACSTRSSGQAIRYAVLALDRAPGSADAVQIFELALTERLETAQYADAPELVELGQFLTEHRFDHYASQLFRRATELNPRYVSGWAALALSTPLDTERARALDACLQLDEGWSAAEASHGVYHAPVNRSHALAGALSA